MGNMRRDGAVILKGLAALIASIPALPLLVRDIERRGRYANRPDEIFYDSSKPTPNTVDFPEGLPSMLSVAYLTQLHNWASR